MLLNNSACSYLELCLTKFNPNTASVGLCFALSGLMYNDLKNVFVVYCDALLKLSKTPYVNNMKS